MDTQTALLTKFHGILTADATLIAAMGGAVRVYHLWGVEDAVMPYLVQRIDLRANEGECITRSGTYILDIWSDKVQDASEALAIRHRIITLLDELTFDIGTDVIGCRMWLQTDGFIPEQGYWHIATQWNLRFARAGEIANIIGR